MNTTNPERLETQNAALIARVNFAAMLGIGLSTFDRLKAAGLIGPQVIRCGGAVKWLRTEVLAWLEHRNGEELYDAKPGPPFGLRSNL